MRAAGPAVLALTLVAAGCSSAPETGLRAFPDAEPRYSKERARIICESRADREARNAVYRAREAIRRSGWSEPNRDDVLADVERRVYHSELSGCLAEFGYYVRTGEA